MPFALVLGVLIFAAAAFAEAASGPRAGGAALDFGDAPDGALAGYVQKPRVRGTFPSRASRGGPRHPATGPRIGMGWNGESDSRQVDRDRDDGPQLTPRACAMSTITVAIDASRAAPGQPLYVNAWFDWDQDGDWADGGNSRCGPEWGIQNKAIDPASLGPDRIGVVTLSFRAGRVPAQFWYRVQVHTGAEAPHAGGGGQAAATGGGETEDWLYERVPPGRTRERLVLKLRCSPQTAVIDHGGSHEIKFSFIPIGGNRIRVLRVRHRVLGIPEGVRVRRRTAANGLRSEVEVRSIQKHDRDPRGQLLNIFLDVDAVVNGKNRNFEKACRVLVMHTERVTPPFEPPRELDPVPRGGFDPKVDPNTAACRARLEKTTVGPPGAGVQIRCDGIDPKTMSVSAGSTDQTITDFRSDGDCRALTEARALRCNFAPPTRGRVLTTNYTTSKDFSRTTVHILAGGRGTEGNTIVLRQDYFFTQQGVVCRQSVPRADQCASL